MYFVLVWVFVKPCRGKGGKKTAKKTRGWFDDPTLSTQLPPPLPVLSPSFYTREKGW